MKKIITSESVTEGHPDKVCDLISDSILDKYLSVDSNARVAVETIMTNDLIIVAGEISSKKTIDIEKNVRNVLKKIGYDNDKTDIDYKTCRIETYINKQSKDIAIGVNAGGAGDQGIMYGYACDETKEFMPLPIMLAHKISKQLTYVRKKQIIKGLRPDGKVQVSIEYKNNKAIRIDTIIISTQHKENVDINLLKSEITTVLVSSLG